MKGKPEKRTAKHGRAFPKLLVGVPVILSIAVAVYLSGKSESQNVLHREWERNETNPYHMTEWLVKLGRPVVLSQTPFDSWQSSEWSPDYLRHKSVPLILSKRGRSNVFKYFASDQPLSGIPEMYPDKSFKEVVYEGERLFQKLVEPFDGYYYYASGGIELLEMEELYTEESLKSLTFPQQSSLGQVNFWFGRANVTAYTHYDTSDNLHVMVYGRKKFLLFPPSAYTQLKLYPCLHPFYRQVQVDVLQLEPSLALKPLEVVLTPGEVLYIPPYWFHCVITMETMPGISLNVWSDSESYLIMEQIFASPIPFEESWGRRKLMGSLQYLIGILVQNVITESPNFVREIVYARYKDLIEKDAQIAQKLTDPLLVHEYCLRDPLDAVLDQESIHHIHKQVNITAGLFLRIRPQAVREINLGNYIEHLGWRILGTEDILHLPLFMRECF